MAIRLFYRGNDLSYSGLVENTICLDYGRKNYPLANINY